MFPRLRNGVVTGVVAGLLGGYPAAQTAAAPVLKAAFLYNFAKFTEWPADVLPTNGPLSICATDEAVVKALVQTTAGRTIDGHVVEIQLLPVDSPKLRTCHVLYAADLDRDRAVRLMESLQGASILTVSDLDQFVRLGGVAEFFVEDGRMRFAIGVESARRARLQLSSKLLSLAKII
jgi:hypothetical protein